ncbi:MAG: FKBP-type peptidyl-prolyl cis-trans isomerase [Burkholderiaceae bacterium]|nr:FKBP-type peptidyl-prolyl cis-trans isomerase [Burkholderiaceae bacterium]
MKITEQCVVALSWTLKDTLGEVLDHTDEPTEFLVGGDDLLAKIEEALLGQNVGGQVQLQIEPTDAFGDYNEQLVFLEPRKLFPDQLEEGMVFEGLPEGCNASAPKDKLFFVCDIYPEHVVLDANHPLAGIAIRLTLKVQHVREATVAEVGAGTLGRGFFRIEPPQAQDTHTHGHDHDHDHVHDEHCGHNQDNGGKHLH